MSRKSRKKWFDPSDDPPVDIPVLQSSAGVSQARCKAFMALCTALQKRGRLTDKSYNLFDSLRKQSPSSRLARNLSTVLQRLSAASITAPLADLLTKREWRAVVEIQKACQDWEMRATAQGLLNVREREQLVKVASGMFREERARHWDPPLSDWIDM